MLQFESRQTHLGGMWHFPAIRGTVLGVLIVRILLSRVLYLGSPIFGNSHMMVEPYRNKGSLLLTLRVVPALTEGFLGVRRSGLTSIESKVEVKNMAITAVMIKNVNIHHN